jgi:hypothetical protein
MKKVLLTLLVLSFSVACKRLTPDDELLQISVAPDSPTVLMAPLQTCLEVATTASEASVQAPSFLFSRFSYRWNGHDRLDLVSLQLIFESTDIDGGEFTCTFTDTDLKLTLSPSPTTVSGDDSRIYSSGCAIRCGGIAVRKEVQYTVIPGKVVAYGIQTSDGQPYPVTAESDIALIWDKRH